MKLRLFAVAFAALSPALLMLAYNEVSNRERQLEQIREQALNESRQLAFEMERIVDGVGNLLVATSAIPAIASMDQIACVSALKKVADETPSIRRLLIVGLDGRLLCDSRGTTAGGDYSDRSYFKLALSRNKLVVGDYMNAEESSDPILPVAIPLRSSGGGQIGVLATGLRLDWLSARLHDRGFDSGAAVTVADRHGRIVARYPYPERFVGISVSTEYSYLVTAPKTGTIDIKSRDGTDRVLAYQPATITTTELYISTGISKAEAFASINRTTVTGVIFIAIGSVVALLAAWFIGNTFISRPIARILMTLSAWRSGRANARTGMSGTQGEIEKIGETIDQLLDELVAKQSEATRSEARRQLLTQELSHRLKNTLAIAVSIAQQMFKDLAGEAQKFAQRLNALAGAHDLLLADSWENAEIEAIVSKMMAAHTSGNSDQFRTSGPQILLQADLVLALSLALHELATNAVKYGALSVETGSVAIEWRLVSGDKIEISWTESGGPVVIPPSKTGFGSRLLHHAFPGHLTPSIQVDYAADGLKCLISFNLFSDEGDEQMKIAG